MFDLFHNGKKLNDGYTFLCKTEDLDDGSEEFHESVVQSINYLQLHEQLTSNEVDEDWCEPVKTSLAFAQDSLADELDPHFAGAEIFKVKLVKRLINLRFFLKRILNINENEELANWYPYTSSSTHGVVNIWYDHLIQMMKELPDNLPNVPEKYKWMKYFPGCDMIIFIDEKMIDESEEYNSSVPDNEVYLCL